MKNLIFIAIFLFVVNLFAFFTDTVNQERGGKVSMPVSFLLKSVDGHNFNPMASIGIAYGLDYDFSLKANICLPINSENDYSANALFREDINFDRQKRYGFFLEGGAAFLGKNDYFFPLRVAVKYRRRFGEIGIGSSALIDFKERNPVSLWLGVDFIVTRFFVVALTYDRFVSDSFVIRDLFNLTLKIKF
jgi:hypothetical protein